MDAKVWMRSQNQRRPDQNAKGDIAVGGRVFEPGLELVEVWMEGYVWKREE